MKELSREDIKSWIKSKLGYPVVMVELTDEQLDICIDDSLDELAPWIIQPEYATLPVSECIDLSDYDASYVIRVHKGDKQSSMDNTDVFNPMSYMTIMKSSSGYFEYNASYRFMDKMVNNTKDNISFKYIKPKLYLDIGYPSSTTCVIEYSKTILDVKDITDQLYIRLLKQFALVYARLMIYEIRGKYTVSNSPTSLNADTELNQANQDLENLRQQLLSSVSSSFILD